MLFIHQNALDEGNIPKNMYPDKIINSSGADAG